MNLRTSLLCATLATGLFGLPQATACIEIEPRHNVEFLEGSAEIDAGQRFRLMEMLRHAHVSPSRFRISVRGYADRAGSFDAGTWSAEDRALADARAQALSLLVRAVGDANCVERVAIGAAPGDAPPVRVDEQGRRWQTRAVLVLAKPGTVDTPQAGVTIETDCGPPVPPREPAPATAG